MMDGESVAFQRMKLWCDAFVMTLRVDHTDVGLAAETADHAIVAFNKRVTKGDFPYGD
jgi:hypothetical protein